MDSNKIIFRLSSLKYRLIAGMSQMKKALALLFCCWNLTVDAKEIPFAEAIDLAVERSPGVKSSEAAAKAQSHRHTSAWLNVGPKVTAEYNEVHFRDRLTAPFGDSVLLLRDKESKKGSLTIAQPITGGVTLIEKARLDGIRSDLADTNSELTKAAVAFTAAEMYLRVQQSEAYWQNSQEMVEAAQSQRKDAEAMYNAQRIHKGDFLKFELAVSQAKANAANAKANKDIALFALQESLSAGNDLTVPKLDANQEVDKLDLPEPEAAFQTALNKRKEVGQADKGVKAAELSRKFAYARFIPSVNVFAKLDRDFGEVSFGSEKNTHTVGLQASWDLWTNGADVYELRAASEEVAQAEAGISATNQQVRVEVMQALANLKAAYEALDLSREAVKQADESYRIEQAKFNSGSSTATELLLSQTSRNGAQVSLIAAIVDTRIHEFRMQKALGEMRPALAQKGK